MIPTLIALAVMVPLIVGMVLLVRWATRHQAKITESREASWAHLAEEYGGEIIEASGPWYRRVGTRLELSCGGQDLRLDNYTVSTGQSSVTYTRVEADVPSTHKLQIYKEHAFSGISRMLGGQDVESGDLDYDDAFMIKTDSPTWVQSVLAEPIRVTHLATPETNVQLQDGKLTVRRVGMVTDLEELQAMVKLAAAFALSCGAGD